MTTHQQWLGQVHEEAIDPALPIIDPHHHLWDYEGNRYMGEELLADTDSGHNIVATVFVECSVGYRDEGPEALRPVGETEFAERVAESGTAKASKTEVCAAIVPYADLMLGTAVREVLEAHRDASPTRFRGIRYRAVADDDAEVTAVHPHPPAGIMADVVFREGFAELGKLGLSFDAWIYHHQIPELTELARAFPDTSIVLDHFGGPLGIGSYAGKAEGIFAQWCKSIDALAECPNVIMKLGGINMPVNGFGWHARLKPPTSEELVAATGRYYLHAIDRFGPSRCMFESNFPVDKASCSYVVLWNAFKRMAASFSAGEKASLFHDTAKRVYRIDV